MRSSSRRHITARLHGQSVATVATNAVLVAFLIVIFAAASYLVAQHVAISDAGKFATVLAIPAALAVWLRLAAKREDLSFSRVMFAGGLALALAASLTAALLTLSGWTSPAPGSLLEAVDNGSLAGGAIACAFALVFELSLTFASGKLAAFLAPMLTILAWTAVIWRTFVHFRAAEKPFTIIGAIVGALLGALVVHLMQRVRSDTNEAPPVGTPRTDE